MIGVFDSGLGGLMALAELHRLLPEESTLFLADRKNAPYGTKSDSELVRLVSDDIIRLRSAGAERILVGCCTACTVLDMLEYDLKSICTSIIEPTVAEALSVSENGKIAVLCTEATKRRRAFENAMGMLCPSCKISVFSSQPLVSLVEAGLCDACADAECKRMLLPLCEGAILSGADTLILGCTHFSHIERTLRDITKMKTVSATLSGAKCFAQHFKD